MYLHCGLEFLCACLGFYVFFKSWPLYVKYKEDTLFWFAMWGLICGTLTLAYTITASMTLGVAASGWVPFTYLLERIASSVLILCCVYPPKCKALGLLAILAGYTFMSYVILYVGSVGVVGYLIKRPQELLQILPAAVIYGRLIDTYSPWGRILRYGTLVTLLGGLVMLFSNALFDIPFVVSHVGKLIAYGFSLFASVYLSHKLAKVHYEHRS